MRLFALVAVVSAAVIGAATLAGSTAAMFTDTAVNAANTFTTAASFPPMITSLSPTSGPTTGGTSVVITGTHFTGTTAVTFGGTAASYVVDSDTQITATSPAHEATTVDVRATAPSGTSVNTASDDYDYTFGGPAVSILDAWTGDLDFLTNGMTFDPSPGTDRLVMIAVYGEDTGVIASISSVSLGGTALTIVDATNGEQKVGSGYSNVVWLGYLRDGDIPAGTAITVAWVGGATPDGAFGDPVHVHAVTLTGVDQASPIGDTGGELNASASSIGATAGVLNVTAGDMVVYATVSGQPNDHTPASGYTEQIELDGVTNNMTTVTASKAITLAGTEQPVASWSTAQRLAIVTAVVRLGGGTTPQVTAVSPSSGPTDGGTSVVITGTNFTGATAVTFGGTAAGYVVDSATQITATAPAHAAGMADVLVTTPEGTSPNTASDDYSYVGWWNGSYVYRQQATVSTGASSPLNGYNGYSVQLVIDTATLVTGSKLQADCDDLRIIFWNGASNLELDRDLYGCNAASTEVWFRLQANIGASASDSSYYVYYGNAAAVSPPANRSNVYLHYNDWSTDRLSEYVVGRLDDWHGTGTYTGFTYDAGNGRVNFDTGNNFNGGLRLASFGERDVYIEQTVRYTGCYTGDITQGPMARYSGDGASSDNYYAFVQAQSDGCETAPYTNPAIQKDQRTAGGFCGAGSGTAWPLDGATHRQAFAIWGVNSTNLKGWLDMTPRKPVEAPDVSCADATDHENAGDVAWMQAQTAGSFDDFMVRRYTEPEPTTSLGSEETP